MTATNGTTPWWITERDELLGIAERHLNAFVYHRATVVEAASRLRRMRSIRRILFAMKSNFNGALLRTLAAEGVDFECVSPPEIEHLLDCVPELAKERILFTPNFAPREDYVWARDFGVRITLDNLYPLQAWPELFRDQTIFVRIDTNIGGGHHDHVVTAGQHSKFGIPLFEIDELAELVARAGTRVGGVHSHSGSGIPDPQTWGAVAEVLGGVAARFPGADVLDLGGGLSVPSRAGDEPFDLLAMDKALSDVHAKHPHCELWIEPGRYLVAEAGVLLTHVTQLKGKGEQRYVGVSTGMNALIRPSLYDAHHEIINLSRIDEPATETVTVVGPICETGDTLGRERKMPVCRENDVVLLANAGAYGRVMSSQYNLRPVPEEIVI